VAQVVNYRTAGPVINGVLIQRGTIFGNPYPVCRTRTRAESLRAFENYARHRIANDAAFAHAVLALRDCTLLCGCKPLPCHGDILANLADELALSA